jgi:hypothetical protein
LLLLLLLLLGLGLCIISNHTVGSMTSKKKERKKERKKNSPNKQEFNIRS